MSAQAKSLPVPVILPHQFISEADFMEQLRRAINHPSRSSRVFRQNAGAVALRNRAGKVTGRFMGALTGAADLSGVDGSPDPHTGKPRGRRLEVEVKVDHTWTDVQQDYARVVRSLGAVYVLVRYDHALTLAENVERGVRLVDEALSAP